MAPCTYLLHRLHGFLGPCKSVPLIASRSASRFCRVHGRDHTHAHTYGQTDRTRLWQQLSQQPAYSIFFCPYTPSHVVRDRDASCKYCLVLCMRVNSHISETTRPNVTKVFSCMLIVAVYVGWSFCGGVAIRYLLPVLWTTSRFHINAWVAYCGTVCVGLFL